MAQPRVLVLRAPGTNCDEETAHAFELAGAVAERVHINRLREAPSLLDSFQALCFPGGFSYGDDISAGRVLGNQVRLRLGDDCRRFRDRGGLILGVCNGFQVLMKTGLLCAGDDAGPTATLAWNDSGHYEARWVRLAVAPGPSVFLQGLSTLELPVAHAEGKLVFRDEEAARAFVDSGRAPLRYAGPDAPSPVGGLAPRVAYPANPNGAMLDVAGLSDATGRVLGLMPHPERFVDRLHHPAWSRRPADATPDGLAIFVNAVRHFA